MGKRTLLWLITAVLLVMSAGCASKKEEAWNVSVVNASEDETCINYCDVRMETNSGKLSFQNRNEFMIHLYLYSDDVEQAEVCDTEIRPGGNAVFDIIEREVIYTVGIHADVPEGTKINVKAYGGDTRQQPYGM